MKYLILCCVFIGLVGCAGPEVPFSTADDGQSIIAVGTLADTNDPYDMASAPVITKVTVTRISTIRAVKRKRVSYEQAKLMLECTDAAIDAVNNGYAHKSLNGISQASRMADNCRTTLDKFKRGLK